MARLQELILSLREKVIQRSDGIDELLTNFQITFEDCKKYAFVKDSKGCSRNLIFDEPEVCRLTLSVWKPGFQNRIHDHGQSHCYFKVILGLLEETHFRDGRHVADSVYKEGQVCHMTDTGACHQMKNNHDGYSVSLHVYIPPFDRCNTYDEAGGAAIPVTPSFISRYGFAVDRESRRLLDVLNIRPIIQM
ncbi:cysteine dioxygenase 1-like isoform X2 [Biomphalaria glabrata]|uniref:Cysteine dioxygenase n=1 Tax=Biomphalaria glabrata TaxID=6526 RepID=A0A9W2ZLY2_BIOGL|nr:cysteine dioxygenase 1-like isoform X2 [Biomphalaria glabrata]